MAMAEIKGGEKLKAALAKISAGLKRAGTLKVGFFSESTYPDGTPVAAVAFWNDMGTRTIPPRPFFRNMVAGKSKGWPNAIVANLKATGYDTQRTLEIVGMGIRDQLKQAIRDTKTPPNAPSTIARKGFDKPLTETVLMTDSAGFKVAMS